MHRPYISSVELSKKFGIPASSIRNFRERRGIKTRGKLSYISEEEFISNYNKLKSQQKMAELYNVDHHTIRDYSKKIGFDDSVYKKRVLTDDEVSYIIDNYEKKPSTVISNELGIKQATINEVWFRNGLHGKSNRVYTLENENYFENIDSQDKAYFLGFIAADGCLYKTNDNRQNILKISIQKTDEKVLNLLKKYLGTNKPIQEYTNDKNTYVSLEISSNKIFDDIGKMGLYPNKTYGNTIANVPDEFIPAFIRGYFDGDGSIGKHKDILSASVSIVGYESNMSKIKKLLEDRCIYSSITVDKRKYNVANDGSQFVSLALTNKMSKYCFLKMVYKDSNGVFIDRKYNRGKEFTDLIENSEHTRDKQIVNYYKYAVQKVS